ncbi:MAG: ThiF family adenylyltransferase [Acidobacteria bacterium]|nr:ThiF family adenylyltransferase [Acidobacteriota bacterium]
MQDRYSRQILFPGIGADGQRRLNEARVLVVGAGALGAAHAETLARAGVGFLRIVDRDFVEFSNLQRQSLYSESDALERLPKAVAAKKRIEAINSDIQIDAIVADINHTNIEDLINDVDLAVDGADNFQIRYLLNDAAVKLGKPWIYGAAVSAYGTSMTILPGKTPCLRCVFEEIPSAGSAPTCDTAGVIQPIIASISAIQTTEAIKILIGKTGELHGSLLQIDIWRNDWRKIRLGRPNDDCECCAKHRFEFLLATESELFTTLCGRDSVQIRPPNATAIDLPALAERLRTRGDVKLNEYLVRFAADGFEITVFGDARAIIKGTDDVTIARGLYARYIGT